MIERVSQSFIKEMREYNAGGGCGNLIRKRWVDQVLLDDPEADPGAMELGSYFEFISFGTRPKSGKIPVAQFTKASIKRNGGKIDGLKVKDMKAPYKMAHTNSKILLAYMDLMGFKVIRAGVKLTKGRYEGVIDLEVECQKPITSPRGHTFRIGEKICIDIKYSGLLKDTTPRSNKHGWKWSPVQKEYHGTQAKQYHFISNLDVYFLVTSSTTEGECRFFYTPVDQQMIDDHLREGNKLLEDLSFGAEMGLEARPSLVKCNACPLRHECPDRHTFPHVEEIDLTNED